MRPVGSKYLLEEPLGRGATGTVWRARQRETAGAEAAVAGQPGETVAIKVLKAELRKPFLVQERARRELQRFPFILIPSVDPSSPGSAVDSCIGACPYRRTGFHFAGTCAGWFPRIRISMFEKNYLRRVRSPEGHL